MTSTCSFCGEAESLEKGVILFSCPACDQARYCSEEHQMYDRKHKMLCKTIQGQRERKLSANFPRPNIFEPPRRKLSATVTRPVFEQPRRKLSGGPPTRPFMSDFAEPRPRNSQSPRHGSTASSLTSSGYCTVDDLQSREGSDTSLASHGGSLTNVSGVIKIGSPPKIQITSSGATSGQGVIGHTRRSNSMTSQLPMVQENHPHFFVPCGEEAEMEEVSDTKDHSKNMPYRVSLEDHFRSLLSQAGCCGVAMNQHQALTLRVQLQFIGDYVIKMLNEYGWVVVENFLGDNHCRSILGDMQKLYKQNLFTDGQLMEEHVTGAAKWIRSDKIFWFDHNDDRCLEANNIRFLVSMMDSVVACVGNKITPYKIKGRSRAMIACYPGNGTRYVKHVDNPASDGRCLTCIYYTNPDWKCEYGGTLRLYPESSSVPIDVEPRPDRLVFFFSDKRNPHEVLPVYRHRFALTIWYFDTEEKAKAMERKTSAARALQEGLDEALVPQVAAPDSVLKHTN